MAIGDVCFASCELGGLVEVAEQVSNPGRDTIPGESEIGLLRDDGGVRTELRRQSLGADLPSGASAASILFEVTVGEVGADGLVAVLLSTGTEDCHPEDDEDVWADPPPCP